MNRKEHLPFIYREVCRKYVGGVLLRETNPSLSGR